MEMTVQRNKKTQEPVFYHIVTNNSYTGKYRIYLNCQKKNTAEKYIQKNKKEKIKQIEEHDIDKIYMYLIYEKKEVSRIHRKISKHHQNEKEKTEVDYEEMALDWESARYTKEDKPLNAYDTLYKYYPELEKQILPILKEWGIAKSNMPKEKDIEEYAKKVKNTTIEEIKKEIKKDLEKRLR